jgi:hypothetical protein
MLYENVLQRTWNRIAYAKWKSPKDKQSMQCLFKLFNTVPDFFQTKHL